MHSTVSDGQVACPTQGLVDADACTECGRDVSMGRDREGRIVVICRPARDELPAVTSFQI